MPISKKQLDANRANARKSTGPRSEKGKQTSAMNSITHGLSSRRFIVLPSEQQHFDHLQTTLRAEILPLGALETDAFQQLLHAAWQLRRSDLLEAGLHRSGDPAGAQLDQLERFARLRNTLERSYQRAWRRLRDLQAIRAAELKLSNPSALANAALTPVAPPPQPEKPPESAGAKRSHHDHSTQLFQWLETIAASGAIPHLPLRALLRLLHELRAPQGQAPLSQGREATGWIERACPPQQSPQAREASERTARGGQSNPLPPRRRPPNSPR